MSGDVTGERSETGRTERSRDYRERILTVDSEELDRLFAALLFLFFGVLLAMTPQYDPESRLFPLVIGVPAFVLFGVLLLAQSSSRVADAIGGMATSDMFDFEERFGDDGAEGVDGEADDATDALLARRKRLITISLWTVVLFGLVLLVGFLPATVVFLLGFYRLYVGDGWLRSVGYTAIFTALIIVIFDVIMNTRFYEGVLGVGLPI